MRTSPLLLSPAIMAVTRESVNGGSLAYYVFLFKRVPSAPSEVRF